jgi:hypothetical protein
MKCRDNQTRLRAEGRRLRQALDRLGILSRDLVRSTEDLRRSARRLRDCQARFERKAPPV